MKNQNVKDRVLAFVSLGEGSEKKTISEATSVKGIVLEGALSKLIKEGKLLVEEKEGTKIYSVPSDVPASDSPEEERIEEGKVPEVVSGKKGSKKGKKEKAQEVSEDDSDEKEELQQEKGQKKGARDLRRFRFNGEQHTKGGLVLAVVRKYVDKHKNVSLTKLKEVFPDDLLSRFGVFQEVSKAKTFASGGRERFFLKEDQVIKVQNKKIAVCNQWTSDNIKPFLTAARRLGFDIR
jgi:hypothetical protein